MMPPDFIGRYCWAASAIGGAWQWQGAADREKAAEALAFCYVANARRRPLLPPADREALEVMVALGELITATLTKAANRRIVRNINKVRALLAAETADEMPF